MKRLVLETTDRCNLACRHCFASRHGGKGLLDPILYGRILTEAMPLGFGELAFTGGEPTLHPAFDEFVEKAAELGYRYGLVSNGWTFPRTYPVLLAHSAALTAVTFSLDGDCESTHDAIRGEGSFRRVLQAISICVAIDLPFTINTVIMRSNHGALERVAELAEQLGARGIRYGHFIEGGQPAGSALALTRDERRAAERRICCTRQERAVPVTMAPGYHTRDLFPCSPLADEELNIDWRGNLGRCCHLSGPWPASSSTAVAGNLHDAPFASLLELLRQENELFRTRKHQHASEEGWRDSDYWPCDYCIRHDTDGGERAHQHTSAVSLKSQH